MLRFGNFKMVQISLIFVLLIPLVLSLPQETTTSKCNCDATPNQYARYCGQVMKNSDCLKDIVYECGGKGNIAKIGQDCKKLINKKCITIKSTIGPDAARCSEK